MQRRRGSGINIRAVASFMAYELSDAAGHEMTPEQFKDSVRRSLKGEILTDRTVRRFISAFGFTDREAEELWQAVVHHRYLNHSIASHLSQGQRRFDPSRDYVILSETFTLLINKDGLCRQFDVEEIVMAEQDDVRYFKPLFEGSGFDIEVLEGGILQGIPADSKARVANENNEIYNLLIESPYTLKQGEIHRIHVHVTVQETAEDIIDFINYYGIGASDQPKFNVTIILNFEEGPVKIKHCIWDDNAYENPIVEETLAPGRTRYSMYYPIVHKAFCGFMWPIRRPAEN
ncbi:MAG: hypothetical protein Q3974_04910 [Rothia sp. (in: high G+C Gram-positive bacteria)]|nr:hypothetical protein [Rothia sp. (in: high G+C Gram-positive bacteria)]